MNTGETIVRVFLIYLLAASVALLIFPKAIGRAMYWAQENLGPEKPLWKTSESYLCKIARVLGVVNLTLFGIAFYLYW